MKKNRQPANEWETLTWGKEWKIILGFYWDGKYFEHDFGTISALTNYFRGIPERAVPLGYGTYSNWHPPRPNLCGEVKLFFWFKDFITPYEFKKEFRDVYEFAQFLDENPLYAACVSYKPKSR